MAKQLLFNLEAYFQEIDEAMLCKPGMKKAFFVDLKERIDDFITERQPQSAEEIIAHFGQPKEIAGAFLESLEPKQIKKAMNWKKVVLIGVVLFLLIWAAVGIVSYINANKNADGQGADRGVVENLLNHAEVNNEKNPLPNNCSLAGNDSVFHAGGSR